MTDPIRPTDDEARALARGLLAAARYASLGVVQPGGLPLVTRAGFGLSPAAEPMVFISALAAHTQALRQNPACSMLVGEPGEKGDPLTHPRLSLFGHVVFTAPGDSGHAEMAASYLRGHPKANLYIAFPDFAFARLQVAAAHLNGGFGKAFYLMPQDLGIGG
jgi:hypothetical protein